MAAEQQSVRTIPFRVYASALTVLVLLLICGCRARPDHVVTFRSPNSEVYYTVETTYGAGPVSNDYTRVFAHFDHGGKSKKLDVISGEYIEHLGVVWTSPTDVDLCVKEGITDTFRNEVTLITGDDPASSYTIHNHLREVC